MSKIPDGARVQVKSRLVDTHTRVPMYIQGKTGIIERCCGPYRNPETLAYGKDGLPKEFLYRVRFFQSELWEDYKGNSSDTADVEIYHHWLSLEAEY